MFQISITDKLQLILALHFSFLIFAFNRFTFVALTQTNNNIKNINTQEGFEHLFHSRYAELCSYANVFLNDLDAAEEIVQDLFVKFWENRENINISSSVRSYLFRSVRNSCLNFIKHKKIEETYKQYNEEQRESGTVSVDDEFEGSELEIQIRKAIDQLPPKRKEVFIMSRFEGLKYKEIAEKSGISVKTVENQMGKAIKFLRQKLADYTAFLILMLIKLFSDT